MSDILLHGAAGSPFVRKVQIVLAEKGLAYEHVQTVPATDPPPGLPFPGITPALRPHTPLGRIPFARIGDRWLADSSVIVAYLDRLHPNPPLYPSDPWDYARALWFEEYIDSGAYPKLFGTIFVERVLAPMLFGRPADQGTVDKALTEDLPVMYGYLDAEIGARSSSWATDSRLRTRPRHRSSGAWSRPMPHPIRNAGRTSRATSGSNTPAPRLRASILGQKSLPGNGTGRLGRLHEIS